MKAPTNLKHRPIISANDYDKIDAQYSTATDVRALSIGKAQYDQSEISLKIWRKPKDKKWSRQSEEMPLHRAIDLNILMLGALMTDATAQYPKTILREEIHNVADVDLVKDYYKMNEKFLKPRLEELQKLLHNFLK